MLNPCHYKLQLKFYQDFFLVLMFFIYVVLKHTICLSFKGIYALLAQIKHSAIKYIFLLLVCYLCY